MSQFPPTTPGVIGGGQKPHRGTLVLVLGILGIVLCGICGIVAWVMGRSDLKEMDAGLMDPSGRGVTNAGKICGIVGTVLMGLWLLWVLFVMVLGVGAAAVGAASGGGTP
jgi:hypothetical protein